MIGALIPVCQGPMGNEGTFHYVSECRCRRQSLEKRMKGVMWVLAANISTDSQHCSEQ